MGGRGWIIFALVAALALALYAVTADDFDLADFLGLNDSSDSGDSGNSGSDDAEPVSIMANVVTKFEGFFPGSMSERNNNPGNIEDSSGQELSYSDLETGTDALLNDLESKVDNHPDWTIQQMNNYYLNGSITQTAQGAIARTQAMAAQLTTALGMLITPQTTLSQLSIVAGNGS